MVQNPKSARRRGGILPLVALCLVILFAFLALAIDLGMVAMARDQCQNAADAAALAGARDLNGDTTNNNNFTNAQAEASTAAENNTILKQPIAAGQVTVSIGSYCYDTTQDKFVINPSTKPAAENWTLCQATITANPHYSFARVLGMNTFNTIATATAAHRPRDVVVILDLSTSMRFDSLLGTPHNSARTQTMNPDPSYPKFGPYYNQDSRVYYNGSPVVQATTGEIQGACNFSVETNDGPPLVDDFYQDTSAWGTSQSAFDNYPTTPTPAPSSYTTTPGGDNYLYPKGKSSPPYAQTVYDITNASQTTKTPDPTWENSGSTGGYGANFKGYTFGPSYWGKSFFIWPPDPRKGTKTDFTDYKDWRQRFFLTSSNGPVADNTLLWDTSGNWLAPSSSTYKINYQNILSWLTSSGSNPFPAQLRAGGILYYDHIPQPSDANFSTLNTRFWNSSPQSPLTDPDERFWKDYIDYVIGVQQQDSSTWSQIVNQTGYGDDFVWGTIQVKGKPTAASGGRYMDYGDNPKRPLLHCWFGPMTFLDFTGNVNLGHYWWPGTAHESPTWQLRATVQTALDDIQINHPNDNVAMVMFGNPGQAAGSGVWNRTVVGLGHGIAHNTAMKNYLFWPRYTVANPTTELGPYDLSGVDPYMMPVADGGTNWGYALMLAFNQFSGLSSLRTYAGSPQAPWPGEAGGLGRQGAQKLVILETDGVVNQRCSAGFDSSGGAYNNFYNVRQDPSGANTDEYPTSTARDDTWVNADADAQGIASQLCALDSASSPGYSTTRKPVLIHTIGFGSLYDPANSTNAAQIQALKGLEQLQFTGGKAGGEQTSATTPIVDYKLIYGPYSSRITKMNKAFNLIMEDGQQVTLIK